MVIKEIASLAEFEKEIRSPGLVVVDFYTEWLSNTFSLLFLLGYQQTFH
jgi:hypothetical protein